MTKKQDRWESVLRHLGRDITAPVTTLTASEIKVATRELGNQEEPRLMASMDSERALPEFFRKNNAFLLPIRRGGYAVVHGQGFHELEPPLRTETFRSRTPIELSTLAHGRGESRYLLHALHSGLISRFTGVESLYPTVLGKMGTVGFAFHVNGSPDLSVDSAGMEVDMGLEGPSDVLLFEAKVQPRATFLIRQLYYPYRTFRVVSPNKRVRPIFFVAEPELSSYTFWEYEWTDPLDYGTIQLKGSTRYKLEESRLPSEPLKDIEPDPSLLVVPQADSFRLVAELPALIATGAVDAETWSALHSYDVRQGNYYSQAAEGLGLIKRERLAGSRTLRFALTEAGRRVLDAPEGKQRDALLARMLLRNPVMNTVFHRAQDHGTEGVSGAELLDIISSHSGLTSATPPRRASTIRAYFRWLERVTDSVRVSAEGRIYSREGWEARESTRRSAMP